MLGGHQPDEGHQLLGRVEAVEVADLGHESERCQGVNAAQAAQPGDQLAPRPELGRLPDRTLERLDPLVDQVDRVQVRVERLLLGDDLEPLLAQSRAPADAPRRPGQPPSMTRGSGPTR